MLFCLFFFMVQMKREQTVTDPSTPTAAAAAVTMPRSPDAGDVSAAPARRGSGAVPARRSGSVARRKGAAWGRTLCQLIVQRVGRARGGGGTPGRHRLAKTSRSRGILAGPGGKNKLIQFKRV